MPQSWFPSYREPERFYRAPCKSTEHTMLQRNGETCRNSGHQVFTIKPRALICIWSMFECWCFWTRYYKSRNQLEQLMGQISKLFLIYQVTTGKNLSTGLIGSATGSSPSTESDPRPDQGIANQLSKNPQRYPDHQSMIQLWDLILSWLRNLFLKLSCHFWSQKHQQLRDVLTVGP